MHPMIRILALLGALFATKASAAPPLDGRVGISVAALTRVETIRPGEAMAGYRFGRTSSVAIMQTASRLKSAHFDLVRMVINPLPLISGSQLSNARAIDEIVSIAKIYLNARLSVVIDLHFWSPNPSNALQVALSSQKGQATYALALAQLANKLQHLPVNRVALELLNEPPLCDGHSAVDWNKLQPEFYRGVRSVAPRLPVIVTGCGGQVDGLLGLENSRMFDDPNVIYTFHFYEPFIYTHQLVYCPKCGRLEFPQPAGDRLATQVGGAKQQELRSYLSNGADRGTLAKRFDEVSNWATQHRVPSERVFLGEFGAVIGPPPPNEALRPSELRWLSIVRSLAEQHGFAYAFWIYPNDHSAFNFDPETGFLRKDVVAAVTAREKH
jgi:hypothetical protein